MLETKKREGKWFQIGSYKHETHIVIMGIQKKPIRVLRNSLFRSKSSARAAHLIRVCTQQILFYFILKGEHLFNILS
jgi:hypothetical protein